MGMQRHLPAPTYKLTAKLPDGRGVYSFCMCPGGYVVNASSEEGYLAVNGMSYHARDSHNANSAIVVTVTPEDFRKRPSACRNCIQKNWKRRLQSRKRENSGTEIRGFYRSVTGKEKEKTRSRSLVSGT